MRNSNLSKHIGFTLVELMVTLAIIGIVAGLSAPSMKEMIQTNRIATQAREFITALNFARSEAVNRKTIVSMAATDGSNWANGWQVWLDTDGSGTVNGSETELQTYAKLDNFTLAGTSNTTLVRFDSSGFVDAPSFIVNFSLELTGCSVDNRTITLNLSGRATVQTLTCTP